MIIILLALVLMSSAHSATIVTQGRAFEKGSNHTKLLFTFKRTQTGAEPNVHVDTQFVAPDGTLLVTEEVTFAGGKVKSYLVHHKQTKQEGALEVGERLNFRYTQDGETREDSEGLPKDLVIGPTIIANIQSRWDVLMKGGTESFRFAVLDRKETVGFKFFKDDEEVREGRSVIHFIMKPSSFIIAAVVDPIHFYFWKDTKDIAEIRGRTLPKQQVDGKFKDLDPEILYTVQRT